MGVEADDRAAGRQRPDRGRTPGSRLSRAFGRRTRRALLVLVAVLLVAFLVAGFGFAGSAKKIADGVTIAGVDVGGLTADEAVRRLESKTAARTRAPLTLTAAGKSVRVEPADLQVRIDWRDAAAQALDASSGPLPLRGIKRIGLRISGENVEPAAKAYAAAVNHHLDRLQEKLGDAPRSATLKLDGLEPVIVPGQPGAGIDRARATSLILAALTGSGSTRVAVPVVQSVPVVTVEELEPVAAKVRTMLSAPIRYRLGASSWRITPSRLAQMLVLPKDGRTEVTLGGPVLKRYFANVVDAVNRKPSNAGWQLVGNGRVKVVPAKIGRKLDVAASRKALLAAASSSTDRTFDLVVITSEPERSTEEAEALGIRGLVGSYTTTYGGDPNRLSNVRLVSTLIDDHLIAPGEEFSFNETTGERNAERGFKEAQVIISGELQTGLGGGVCQVSTTVFNAAYEAGLSITSRTNHALYIDHYPLGRDATVNYPDIDLRFVNDTDSWIWLKVAVGESQLTVNLYGNPTGRTVETETTPLRVVGKPKLEKIEDDSLLVGERIVEESGTPPRETAVRRIVRDRDGAVLYDTTWYSSYVSEKRVVRVGTKEPPPAPPEPTETEPTETEPPPAEPAPPPAEPPVETTEAPAAPAPAPAVSG